MDEIKKVAVCKICNSNALFTLAYQILDKYDAQLFRCEFCQFQFIDDPSWLDGTFSDSLQSADIGSVDRCNLVLQFAEELSYALRIQNEMAIDWGGGYGLLTRMARDRGLDFWNFDPYVRSLFAAPADLSEMQNCSMIVVSEVFLHMTEPLDTLKKLLDYAPIVLITAVVPPKELSTNWWYLTPATGQHVAFYSESTLRVMARLSGTTLVTDGSFFHVFSKKKLSLKSRVLISNRPLIYGVSYLRYGLRMINRSMGRNKSLAQQDQSKIINDFN